LIEQCYKNSGKKEDPPPKSRDMQEQEKFLLFVGKEHADRRPKARDVRSLVERIKARSRAG
jgi:hypothetical protein